MPTPAVPIVENGRIAMRVPCAVSAATRPMIVSRPGDTSSALVDDSAATTPVVGAITVPAACST